MHVLTKRDRIKDVAQHWHSQYFVNGAWKLCKGGAEIIYNQLVQLTSDATEEDIAKIIGNRSWTRNQCDDCGEDSDVVAIFAETTAEQIIYVCPKCLRAALAACEAISSSILT